MDWNAGDRKGFTGLSSLLELHPTNDSGVKASASCGRLRDIVVVVQTGCCVLDYCGVDRPFVVEVR
jgi:hypothetical protein